MPNFKSEINKIQSWFKKQSQKVKGKLTEMYLDNLGDQFLRKAKSRMAVVTGEMVNETSIVKPEPGKRTFVVNVPYASYQNEGEREDGSHLIKKRTPPGQKHFVQKAVTELDLQANVKYIFEE